MGVSGQNGGMRYHTTVAIPVPAARAWQALAAIPDWPNWTPTVTAIAVDGAPGAAPEVGWAVTIKQPGRGAVEYRIDVVEPGRRFRWGNAKFGVRQSADHVVVPDGEQACTVELTFAMEGPLGGLLGALGAGKIRQMVDAEANALREHLAP